MDRFENVLRARNLTVMARVDHGENAINVGLTLGPTELIVFGNPRLGTPLMQSSPSVGQMIGT